MGRFRSVRGRFRQWGDVFGVRVARAGHVGPVVAVGVRSGSAGEIGPAIVGGGRSASGDVVTGAAGGALRAWGAAPARPGPAHRPAWAAVVVGAGPPASAGGPAGDRIAPAGPRRVGLRSRPASGVLEGRTEPVGATRSGRRGRLAWGTAGAGSPTRVVLSGRPALGAGEIRVAPAKAGRSGRTPSPAGNVRWVEVPSSRRPASRTVR